MKNNKEIMNTDRLNDVYMYHWDTQDEIEHMKENGVSIADNEAEYDELDFEVGYNGMYDSFIYEKSSSSKKIQLMRVNIENVLLDDRDNSHCVLKEIGFDALGLRSEDGYECIIRPEYIQVSQVFDEKWLRDNYFKEKIIFKFH